MADEKYCYLNTNILKNKKNIQDANLLYQAEFNYTLTRLIELQQHPINGSFDFNHLCKIHKYIFQDLYDWAGKIRTVDIGKGNLFCPVQNIISYGNSVFDNYYSDCLENINNKEKFIQAFTRNYADVNALHPFREGNGRSQREFARELCLACGYFFDLSHTSHKEMLSASILSFNSGDNSLLLDIFANAITPISNLEKPRKHNLQILSSDDLNITF